MVAIRDTIRETEYQTIYGPLSGRGGGDAGSDTAAYAVGGNNPDLVVDYINAFYAKSETEQALYSDVVSFARASAAYYLNSSGVVSSVSTNAPRIGSYLYSGSWVNKGLFFERDARTNIAVRSQELENAVWADPPSNQTTTVTANQATAPDGTMTADEFNCSAVSGSQYSLKRQTLTTTSSITYAGSLWLTAKAAGDVGKTVYVYLNDGSVTFATLVLTSDWQRIRFTEAVGATTTYFTIGSVGSGAGGSDQSAFDFYAWQGQAEAGNTVSSEMPTTTASATRAAETLSIPAANTTGSTSAISFQIDGSETYVDEGSASQVILVDWQADSNNYIQLTLDTDTTKTGTLTLRMKSGGSEWTTSAGVELTPGTEQAFNVACRCTDSEIQIALNGTAATANASPTSMPDLSGADIDFNGMGHRGQFVLWDGADLGESGIETAST